MSINETRREAIINKIKELEEFLEPEGDMIELLKV